MPRTNLICSLVLASVSASLFTGCNTIGHSTKNWCKTIRAAQIIPIYPLTEDVQPGDIFLVQTPVVQQQKIYSQKGYLSLDNHLARINPSAYKNFYDHSFIVGPGHISLPADWIRPHGGVAGAWIEAPNAAFPSYSFSVRRGSGLNLAFPVQGVPVGLSLLGSDAADGTIIVKNARTLGVDTLSLYRQLQKWADENSEFLNYFGAESGDKATNFVRIVSRVYAVSQVDISLRDAGRQPGADKPVDLLFPQTPNGTNTDSGTVRSNFVLGNNILQNIAANALTTKDSSGGSLRLTAASARTISMRETFDPPLIIGYLGFDCSIRKGGVLGPPFPTHGVLDPKYNLGQRLQTDPQVRAYAEAMNLKTYQALTNVADDPRAREVRKGLDDLEKFVPDFFVEYSTLSVSDTGHVLRSTTFAKDQLHKPSTAGYLNYVAWREMLQSSIGALEAALKQERISIKKDAGNPTPIDKQGRDILQRIYEQYVQLRDNPQDQSTAKIAVNRAQAYYFDWVTQ